MPEPEPEQAPPHAGSDDWERHWGRYAESNSRNPAQAYRRKLVLELLELESGTRPSRLIELGCGHGDFARDLSLAYPKVEIAGIDLGAAAVALASQKVPRGRFWQCDMMKPVTPPPGLAGWATHAVCSEVLEHVDEPEVLLRNARPLFAPGCRLVITVPGGPMSAFDRHIGHRRHFTMEKLRRVIERAGLDVALVHGAGFPFFNLYRLVVVARGDALVRDADLANGGVLGWAPRAAMRGFDWLFRWNRSGTKRGWQLVARATEPS